MGGFILAFGDMEVITYCCWREYCGDEVPSDRFKMRAGKLLSVLRRAESSNDEVIACLVEALRIVDKHNTVAHNPAQVQVYRHSVTGEIFFEKGISSVTFQVEKLHSGVQSISIVATRRAGRAMILTCP